MKEPVVAAVAGWLAAHAAVGPVTVACSGGADSLALAHAVARCGRAGRAVTVDHGLQDGSADRAAATAEQVREIGFDAVVAPVAVSGGGGVEAAARRARYAALLAHADGPVLLGHTLDDQAETVLLGLARGSGPRSIAGMRPWTPPWGRPLLRVRRADTEACCRGAGVQFWTDPHNADPSFTRVRLRTEVLPLLEDVLGNGVAPALARTADLMADDLAALDRLAAAAVADCVTGDSLAVAELRSRPTAIRRRLLRLWAAAAGADPLTADHLVRLDALVTGDRQGAAVRLPGGLDAVRRGDLVAPVPIPPAGERPAPGDG